MKKKTKKLAAGLLVAALVFTSIQLPGHLTQAAEGNALRLWYDEPTSEGVNILSAGSGYDASSNYWQQQTLPIGNGDMGANVYGEVVSEHLTFNEKTLWTGGPSKSRPNYNGGNLESQGQNGAVMQQIQQLFAEGKDSEASNLCNQLTGQYGEANGSGGYGSYQPWGDIYFDYKNMPSTTPDDYERDLDLTNAAASVSFTANGTKYTREFFISNPDNVLVGRLEADKDNSLNLDVRFTSDQGATATAIGNNTLEVAGELSDNQMQYASYLTVVADGGTVTAGSSKLTVAGADSITVYVSAATDYKNDYPTYRTGETMDTLKTRVKADVDAAAEKGYTDVKADHLADYQEMFNRVTLDLGQTVSDKTTDVLLSSYNAGTASDAEKRQLEVMLFQYGRYLTLASSRENSQLPSNLQGVWNTLPSPPWSSDYHMNVNLQMNYWPTYSTNLAECAEPLIDYVDSLREPGRVTAAVYAGIVSEEGEENGFMAHTQNTPFGWTCPGWSFDWGWSPAAVPWILQNCWEYYEYTGDVEYMRDYIYPMLKEEAILYDQMLVRNSDGELVSSPSYSPEHGPRTEGNTYEQSLIWQLYEDAITAAEILGVDADNVATWKVNQADLKGPIEIGDDGQIKEWYEETTLGSVSGSDAYGHRHLSHMLGLFPGDLIQQNEDWIEAARVSMEARTDSSTGWGMGQRINTWARLGDGNKALELIENLFAGGIYPNLWDSHSPFQIDGNFGMTSGVAEMLLQSNMGFINLLPALPDDWADGSVKGLVARGNFEIDMTWEGTSLTTAAILSQNGGLCEIGYPNIAEAKVTDASGKEVAVTETENGICFETTKGETYTITEVPERPAKAPQNVTAIYMGTQAILEFDEVLNASKYNVYKSVDGETWEKAAEITTNSYTDDAYVIGTMYKIAGVAEGREGDLTAKITPKRLALTSKIDDRDARISYSSGWGNWADSELYGGTEKFSSVTGDWAEFYFYGKAIRVIGLKSNQLYTYNLIIDGKEYGPFDEHTNSGSAEKSVLVGEVTGLENGLHKVQLVTTGTKISLDAFEFDYDTPEGLELEAPENIKAVYVANDVAISFDAVENADSYNVYESSDGSNYALVGTTETTSLLSNTYDEGDTYKVAAVIDSDEGLLSDAVTPSALEMTEKIDDRDDRITYSSGWGDWSASDHYEGTQKFTGHGGSGDTAAFYFYGNAVRVIGNKNSDHHTFDLYIDGEKVGSYNTNAPSEAIQQTLAEVSGLENGLHSFKLVVTEQKISLDAFEFDYSDPVPVAREFTDLATLQANAKSNSEQTPAEGSDGPASYAFNGNDGNWWHSRWVGTPAEGEVSNGQANAENPIWIQTGFNKVFYLETIEYSARGNGRGIIKNYTVSVANLDDPTATPADDDFTVVKTVTGAASNDQTITLDEVVPATHVRITVSEVHSSNTEYFVSAKKISFFGYNNAAAPDEEAATKEDLMAAIGKAAAYDSADYTTESYAALMSAMEAAGIVLYNNDATAKEIADAIAVIEAAIQALEPNAVCAHAVTKLAGQKEATCTEEGYTGDTVCSECNEIISTGTVIPKKIHTTEVQNAKAATCTAEGYTGDKVCTVCGNTVETGNAIAKLAHTTEVQNAKAATCTEEGYTGDKICTVCGNTVETGNAIAKLAHTWSDWNVVKEATAEEAGSKERTCSVCGEKDTDVIPKLEEKPDEKPDEQPEQKPDEKPDEQPEQKPDEKPNDKPSSPTTGDTAAVFTWFAAAFAMAMTVITLIKKRSR